MITEVEMFIMITDVFFHSFGGGCRYLTFVAGLSGQSLKSEVIFRKCVPAATWKHDVQTRHTQLGSQSAAGLVLARS